MSVVVQFAMSIAEWLRMATASVQYAPMWRLALTVILCCSVQVQAAAPATALPEPLARSLQRLRMSTDGISIYVHEVGSVEPLFVLAADAPRSPASVIKLLPTLAALEDLGSAYQWQTELWSAAPVSQMEDGGRLDGDLYIKGYGDPYLVIEHFWRLLRQLRQLGIVAISGDLVVDQSHFAPEPEDPAAFDGRPQRVYNVPPSALLVNFQAVNFRFVPDIPGNRVRIVAEPWPALLALENNLRLTRANCRGGWASHFDLRPRRREQRDSIVFSGAYDAACGEREIFRVVSDPTPYIHGVFKTIWAEMGGHFDGGVREAPVPEAAQRLASITSPPLADVIRSVNKFSNNVMTRQLLLTLGAEAGGAPGTTQKGMAAIQNWMSRRGLVFPELVLENGTGLSRKERISARHLGELLLAGFASPAMPEFLSSFPVAGMDGTMRHRLIGPPLAGRVHLKTGSIENVNTIAGYVLDQSGRRMVVVVLHNHPRADTAAGTAFQDAVLDWVYRRPSSPSSPGSLPPE